VGAANPSWPFAESDWIADALARTAEFGEDAETALGALQAGKVEKYHTPTAEWLHGILRSVFADQFPQDDVYDSAFDRAEVFLGVTTQDQLNEITAARPEQPPTYRPNWFGRSTWCANNDRNPVEDLIAEFTTTGEAWGPLKAGLFDGRIKRASAALVIYLERFNEVRASHE
jgi:hypothetical protein